MTPKETGKLLGFAALYDARKVDPAVTVAWHQVLSDIPYADAEAAVRAHYAESPDRLMPAHVRSRVRSIQAERLRQNPLPPPPPELVDDGPAYARWIENETRRIASGDPGRPAIGGPS